MNAIKQLIDAIFRKIRKNEHITELEWVLDIAHKDTSIDKGTLNKAAAELARYQALEAAARELVNNLPESVIEEAREVWLNTNTRIILEARQKLAALLGAKHE